MKNGSLFETVAIELRHNPIHAVNSLAIVDIDDVLADFPAVFLSYVMKRTGEPWSQEAGQYGLEDALVRRYGPGGQSILNDFYESDALKRLPIIPGARDFISYLKALGFSLWAVTGRPGHKYERTAPDTAAWLAGHGV